jgi:hypothetical protein
MVSKIECNGGITVSTHVPPLIQGAMMQISTLCSQRLPYCNFSYYLPITVIGNVGDYSSEWTNQ